MPRKPADKSAAKKPSTRKKKEEVVEAVAETATVVDAPTKTPAPKKRGRKKAAPAENVVTEAPAKKTRDKKKVAPQAAEISEAAVAEEPLPGQLAFDGESTNTVADAPAPARKARKPRTKKAENKPTDDTPKKRGRKAKETGPVLTTTLQIGDKEYDISDLAAKALKAYKSTHKRKVVTDFHVYVKPEENAAYFTVNGEGSADFKVDL